MSVTDYTFVDDALPELETLVAAEPQLPLLPQVFHQPPLAAVCRGEADSDALIRQWTRAVVRHEPERMHHALQALQSEFAPLINWALASWDFLLTTEGCRFLPRKPAEKWGMRGDFRACQPSDYHRLLTGCFRDCVTIYVQSSTTLSLAHYLAETFWPLVRARYQALSLPPDSRQRDLTAYSYLRCVPYRFLNEYHERLVHGHVRTLQPSERRVLELYFLHFFTEAAVAHALTLGHATMRLYRRRGLQRLARTNTLAAALLLQIERY